MLKRLLLLGPLVVVLLGALGVLASAQGPRPVALTKTAKLWA